MSHGGKFSRSSLQRDRDVLKARLGHTDRLLIFIVIWSSGKLKLFAAFSLVEG